MTDFWQGSRHYMHSENKNEMKRKNLQNDMYGSRSVWRVWLQATDDFGIGSKRGIEYQHSNPLHTNAPI